MRRVFIVVFAFFFAVGGITAKPNHGRLPEVEIVRMEEPDIVRKVPSASLLRLVKEEKFREQGFGRIRVKRGSEQSYLVILSELASLRFCTSRR